MITATYEIKEIENGNDTEKKVEKAKKKVTRKTSTKKAESASKKVKSDKKVVSKTSTVKLKEVDEVDEYLFHEGKHRYCYEFMGAHQVTEKRKKGVRFTTWAPNASKINIIGDFNYWEVLEEYSMNKVNDGGLWSLFVPGLKEGMKYKFAVTNRESNNIVYKCDPYAITSEMRPNTASILTLSTKYKWSDKRWLNKREKSDIFSNPMNIYEVHLGSWKTKDGNFMTYDELSEILPSYVKEMGYTHIELMPLNEHPLDASWGYQATGYYSINSRHGSLLGLKKLINNLHKEDIGIILDWVPGHFCKDQHGLINFDGSPAYEYPYFWKAENKGWGTNNFDLGRNEVKSFLISNAMYWIKEFHIDGLRVDAVSNMIYLSYGREPGEWEANIFGDERNLEGINFLQDLNSSIKEHYKGVVTIAEESSAYPKITHSIEDGGLGFDFKWNMGWMNDTLKYVELDPVYRKYHHNKMNFSMMYNYSEKFILPISHDEVVHMKKALVDKMWGDIWNKFAGLRLYATYMIGHPGKKLLFMGSEFAQFVEWREYEELQWRIIDEFNTHREAQGFFKELNKFYKENKALWELDYDPKGFNWIDADNADQSVLSFIRNGNNLNESLIFICNFTPVVYYDFKVGVSEAGKYIEVFNSDRLEFGGSGQIIDGEILSTNDRFKEFENSINIKVPPMATIVLKRIKDK